MAQPPNVCTTCYGTNLVLQGGFLTCADCGTQAQTILEETEYGDAAQGRARRSIRAVRAAGTGAPDDSLAQQMQQSRRAAEAAALLYTRALQALARAQARALHERLGAHRDVESLVRQLWLPAVAASGVLEPGIVEREVVLVAAAAAATGAAAATPTTTPSAAAAATIHHQKVLETRPEALQRRFGAALPAQTTLAVAFAALALAREPVVPGDVIAWALDGTLPFAELPTVARPLLRRAAEEEEERFRAARVGGGAGCGGGAGAGAAGSATVGAAELAAGALRAQLTLSPAQLAERAEQVAALALRSVEEDEQEEEDGDRRRRRQKQQHQHQPHALPPANGEALLRRLGRALAEATGGAAPCAAAVSLACELHDMYLLGTPALAFVRDSGLFGGSGAAVAGPWAPGAGPPPPPPPLMPPLTPAAGDGQGGAAAQGRQQEIAVLVPAVGGASSHQQQNQSVLLRVPLAVVAAGGGGGGGGGNDNDADAAVNASGASLPTWVGQGMGRHAHPFAAVAAALVVALKLLHGSLEGQQREGEGEEAGASDGDGDRHHQQHQQRPSSILPGPEGGWQRWASRAVRHGPQPHVGTEDDDDDEQRDGNSGALPQQGSKKRRAFLLAARRRAFAGSGPPEALEEVQRVLMMLAQVGEGEQEDGQVGERRQQEEAAGGGGSSRSKRRRRRREEEEERQQPPVAVSASAADGRYLLAADASTARAPPDYVAVLAAVAAHAHTDPFTLHALVRQLERRALAAESSLLAMAQGAAGAAG